jgi:hypothetical protein
MKIELLFTIAAFIFLACGYALSGSKSALGEKYQKIFVEVGVNLTPFSELEDIIVSALKDSILEYGDLTLVSAKEEADAVFVIDLLNFERSFGGLGKTGTFDVDEYQLLTYEVKFVDSLGAALWSSGERKAYSFTALSLAAFDEGGFDLLEKGYKTKDFRSVRDVHNVDTNASFQRFATEIKNLVTDQVLEPDF